MQAQEMYHFSNVWKMCVSFRREHVFSRPSRLRHNVSEHGNGNIANYEGGIFTKLYKIVLTPSNCLQMLLYENERIVWTGAKFHKCQVGDASQRRERRDRISPAPLMYCHNSVSHGSSLLLSVMHSCFAPPSPLSSALALSMRGSGVFFLH